MFGFFKLGGVTMLAMYLLGIIVALLMAWIFKKTLLKGETPMLIMELPPYKRPVIKATLRHMWDRSKQFLTRAGTVILGINIILWALMNYPTNKKVTAEFEKRRAEITNSFTTISLTTGTGSASNQVATLQEQLDAVRLEEAGETLRHSFAGLAGRAIEPVIAPLGFDWKIGIGIVGSFAAREVFVSTMSTVYNASDADDDMKNLKQTLQEQKRADGTPVYTALTAVTLMVFYVFAMQCVSTVAVVRRETSSWWWPFFQWLYMGVLAWVLAFITYHGGKMLGWG